MWRFQNLPREAGQQIRDLYAEEKYLQLFGIYNQYQVPPQPISTCCGLASLLEWTRYGIEQNLIPWTEQPDTSTGSSNSTTE